MGRDTLQNAQNVMESAVGSVLLCGLSLGLVATSPLGQQLSKKDIHIPSAGWGGLDWCLYRSGGHCEETFELWCLKVEMWDVC